MRHLIKWLYPGMKMKRWLLLFAVGVVLVTFGAVLGQSQLRRNSRGWLCTAVKEVWEV